jgi:hypothetical protein
MFRNVDVHKRINLLTTVLLLLLHISRRFISTTSDWIGDARGVRREEQSDTQREQSTRGAPVA